jgi:hypothetical protein
MNSETRIENIKRCTFTENDTIWRRVSLSGQRWMNIAVKPAYKQTTCHYECINGKNTRHHEFGTTVNVFEVILLASTPRKSLNRKYKPGSNIGFSPRKKNDKPSRVQYIPLYHRLL